MGCLGSAQFCGIKNILYRAEELFAFMVIFLDHNTTEYLPGFFVYLHAGEPFAAVFIVKEGAVKSVVPQSNGVGLVAQNILRGDQKIRGIAHKVLKLLNH